MMSPSPIFEFAVLDPAIFALDFDPDLKAEGIAQPIDGRGRILIDDAARKRGQPLGVGFMLGLRVLMLTIMDNVNEVVNIIAR